MAITIGNATLSPPRATGNAEVDLRATMLYVRSLYDLLIVGGNVLGSLTDHETRIRDLEERVSFLENP